MPSKTQIIIVSSVILLGTIFRLIGLNWDSNFHLHPDERFLTMVTTAMTWPTTFSQYLDTDTSTVNPHNLGFDFYVYGIWPLLMVKTLSHLMGFHHYDGITLVGRISSTLMEIITMISIYGILTVIRQKITPRDNINLLPVLGVFSYATMALPIQLAHFYTVDPYITAMSTLTIWLLVLPLTPVRIALLGITTALALAAKVSMFPLLIVSACTLFFSILSKANSRPHLLSYSGGKRAGNIDHNPRGQFLITYITQLLIYGIIFSISFLLVFRIFYPYLFNFSLNPLSINPKVLENWKTLSNLTTKDAWFPPSFQWIATTPWFSIHNLLFIGLGIVHSSVVALGIIRLIYKPAVVKVLFPSVCFIGVLGLYQIFQFAKPLRYLYPLYPQLALLAALGLWWIFIHRRYGKFILFISFCLMLLWPVAITSIYIRPNTRVAASEWIFTHVPAGAAISYEHWDDPLPLRITGFDGMHSTGVELPMFAPESTEKWQEINDKLNSIDYLVLSSNRAYGSLTAFSSQFPETATFYADLFSGNTPFVKIAEFTSRPTIPLPGINVCIQIPISKYGIVSSSHPDCTGITIIDDYVDESWTVYDHAKVTIFKRQEKT